MQNWIGATPRHFKPRRRMRMFTVNYNGQVIRFTFAHTHGLDFHFPNGKIVDDVTNCRLEVEFNGNSTEYNGVAACIRGDQFSKELGRKIALTRALKEACLKRGTRTAVWRAYFDRKPTPLKESEPHIVSMELPTEENDPIGRFRQGTSTQSIARFASGLQLDDEEFDN
jgi:hypothetical protein